MNDLERKTVFLYPAMTNLTSDEIKLTNNLIASMNFIVNSVNELVRTVLTGGNFAFIDYLPSVLLKCVTDDDPSDFNCKNVRICIIGFNNIDYKSNYKKIINEFASGKSDISHLVAIHIVDGKKPPKFVFDESKCFDVLIHTSMDDLENVLASIMLDISLYHYFSLSGDLDKRKTFNIKKHKYLRSTLTLDKQKDIYGQAIDERPIYLSFSLERINILSRRKKLESRSETINDLIHDFESFILSVLSHEIKCNNRGSIFNPDEHRNSIQNFDKIEDYIREHKNLDQYYVIAPHNLTDNNSLCMINYDHDSAAAKDWVGKVAKAGEYDIIKVIIEKGEA